MLAAALTTFVVLSHPQEPSAANVLAGKGAELLRAWQLAEVKRAAHREVPASRDAFETWRKEARAEHLGGLGLDPLPERTPLGARITGTLVRDGYRIEKVLYESRPGFPVTAHLYVPDGLAGKAPVIVNPHGHWSHKKQEPVVQMRAIAQAKAGYVAFVVDSPGHSFEGKARIERREAGTHDDLALVQGSTNTTGVYVWDLMRGLDYLATRPECDMTKVGITGASGGGLATVYAFAADERFTCAVPVVYATSAEVNPNNGCLCNHVPGTLRVGDRADVLALRAPLPVLVIGAQQDGEFPPEGTELTGRKLKALWGVFGAADRVRAKVFPGPHDYNQAMREEALGFFDLHLRGMGDGSPRKEPKCEPLGAEDPQLFVGVPAEAWKLTMRAVAQQRYAAAPALPFAAIARLNGGVPDLPPAKLTSVKRDGATELVTIASAGGVPVPGIALHPEGAPKRAVIYVDDRGKVAASSEAMVATARTDGALCVCLDSRGSGELAALDLRLLTYLGTSVPFAMAIDVVQAARAMRTGDLRIEVVGRGPVAAQAALFAAALEPAIASVREVDGLRELDAVFGAGVPISAVQPRGAHGVRLEAVRKELGARLQR